jgi:hypothetical protein
MQLCSDIERQVNKPPQKRGLHYQYPYDVLTLLRNLQFEFFLFTLKSDACGAGQEEEAAGSNEQRELVRNALFPQCLSDAPDDVHSPAAATGAAVRAAFCPLVPIALCATFCGAVAA